MDVRAIREAIASDAESADGITRAHPFVPLKIALDELPLVIVGNPSIDYGRTFGKHAKLELVLWAVIANAGDPDVGSELLDGFVSQQASPDSLAWNVRQVRASEQRPWTVNVLRSDPYELIRVDSTDYYAVPIVIEVNT